MFDIFSITYFVQVQPEILQTYDITLNVGELYLAVVRLVKDNPQTMWDGSKVLR